MGDKAFDHAQLNKRLVEMQYAVRGPIVAKAMELKEQLKKGAELPFKDVVMCNIGNPQSLEQKPITFYRQVLSLVEYPELINHPLASQIFPADALQRASVLLSAASPGGIGAYTNSTGIPAVRHHIADFIQRRDGFPAIADNIFLTNGASDAIRLILTALIRGENDGVLCPVPQYPIYSALMTLLGGTRVDYFLDEDNNWALDITELKRALSEARDNGVNVRALVIINPGNPTGAVLAEENIKQIVEFCKSEKILILADEVYQENVYKDGASFHSFKKVTRSLGPDFDETELISFHSTSKGLLGECGHRGGYMELCGIEDGTMKQLNKLASAQLCSVAIGQILVDLMVLGPQPSDPSFETYTAERSAIFDSLKRRAHTLTVALNELEGVVCNSPDGAMYAFPRITLSQKAIAAAAEVSMVPDEFYSLSLLEHSGICVVPGSGFGQRPGTHHFRTTFLPPEHSMYDAIERIKQHHIFFMDKFRDPQ